MFKYIIFAVTLNVILFLGYFTKEDVSLYIGAPASAEAGSTIDIELELHKSAISGFARFHQELPPGISASPVYPSDVNFSFDENTIRMIWLNLPGDKTFSVRYRLHIHERLKGQLKLDGTFSYIENNERMTASAGAITVNINPSPFVDEKLIVDISEADKLLPPALVPVPVPVTEAPVAETPVTEARVAEARVTEAPVAEAPVAETPVASQLPTTLPPSPPAVMPERTLVRPLEPEQGVYYRVQLAAGRRPVDPESYFRNMSIPFNIHTEIHDGWYKYSIGSFYDYRSARDQRVNIWNTTPVGDAFVSAYSDGVRITVQEALAIASHRWYR